MPFPTWNIGSTANDGTGDTLRAAFANVTAAFAKPALLPFGSPVAAPAADQFPYYGSSTSISYAAVTSFARTILDDTSAGAVRTTLNTPAMSAPSMGVANMNSATLGQWQTYNGLESDAAANNWPSVGSAAGTAQWWNVFTMGSSTRITQIASHGFNFGIGRTFVRHKHDSTWGAWREWAFTDSSTTLTQPLVERPRFYKDTEASPTDYRTSVSHATFPSMATVSSVATQQAGSAIATGRGHQPAIILAANTTSGDRYCGSIVGLRTMGGPTTHTAASNNKSLVKLVGAGSDGVDQYRLAGEIGIEAAETFSATAAGGRLRISLTAAGAILPTDVLVASSSSWTFTPGGATQFQITSVASAVNYLQAAGNVAGSMPTLSAVGSDTDIGVRIAAKGTGGTILLNNGAGTGLQVTVPASAVNYVRATGAATGNGPTVSAQGSDTNLALNLTAKGTQSVWLGSGGGWGMRAEAPASTVNRVAVVGSATTVAPSIVAEGTDTNISLSLAGKGTGTVDIPVPRLDRCATADTSVGSNPTGVVVTFPTAGDYASGLSWDGTNHRCTPTVAGLYLVTLTLLAIPTTASGDIVAAICRNGAERHRWYRAGFDAGLFVGDGISAMLYCNGTSDYIDVRFSAPAAGATSVWAGRRLSIVRVGV